jgi:type VI secretion system protein ImpH
MAAKNWPTGDPVASQLFQHPERFDFFQAVRLLEQFSIASAEEDSASSRRPVGRDFHPKSEAVRFRAKASHSFPATEICELRLPEGKGSGPSETTSRADMIVAFQGLTGPQGVLPDHYTRLLIQRLRVGDVGMPEFFDLFNHRIISLFYRAWEKYRIYLGYERASRQSGQRDLFTAALLSLAGMGTPALADPLAFDQRALAYYSGLLSFRRPVPVAIEQLLCEYFQVPVELVQFSGSWLCLSREDQTRLQSTQRGQPAGHNVLGGGALVGSRVWDMHSKFLLRIGPVDYATFRRFMPMGDSLRCLCQWVRMKVGVEFDFEIQMILIASHVPALRLGSHPPDGSRLGWNTWLSCRPPDRDVDHAIFSDRSLVT